MTTLPCISGKELVKILRKVGYYIRDQKGSHIHLRHFILPPITVPNHKTIAKGTLKNILNITGLTVEKLNKLR